jgi:hypothetical protein
MSHDLKLCLHCHRDFKVRVSEDIGFRFHWIENYYHVDVVYFGEGYRVLLFGEVWVLANGAT